MINISIINLICPYFITVLFSFFPLFIRIRKGGIIFDRCYFFIFLRTGIVAIQLVSGSTADLTPLQRHCCGFFAKLYIFYFRRICTFLKLCRRNSPRNNIVRLFIGPDFETVLCRSIQITNLVGGYCTSGDGDDSFIRFGTGIIFVQAVSTCSTDLIPCKIKIRTSPFLPSAPRSPVPPEPQPPPPRKSFHNNLFHLFSSSSGPYTDTIFPVPHPHL